MDEKPPNCIPTEVTVGSELEKVVCKGTYTPAPDGFCLEFDIGDSKYSVRLASGAVFLRVEGELRYEIDFSRAGSVKLETPYGSVDYEVSPNPPVVKQSQDSILLGLEYSLINGADNISRAVNISARYLSVN